MKHRYRLLPVFFAGLFFILLAPVYWTHVELPQGKHIERAYENADLYESVYPNFAYGFGRLAKGDLPLWNPEILCGIPFWGNPGNGILQPLNLPFLFMAPERAMALHAFLSLALMGFFFVLFARSLDLRYWPAGIGALAYAFGGTSAAVMSRPAVATALVWLPLLLWAMREFCRKVRPGFLAPGIFSCAALLLSGSLAATFAMLCLALPYALFLAFPGAAWEGPSRWWKRSAGLLLIFFGALALVAVQAIPAWFWIRGLEAPLATLLHLDFIGALPGGWRAMVRLFLVEEGNTLPKAGYIGIVSLPFLLLGLLHRRSTREGVFFGLSAFLVLSLALSSRSILAEQYALDALFLPASLSLSVLIALGVDRVFQPSRDFFSPRVWTPIALVAAIAILLLFAGGASARGRLLPLFILLIGFGLVRSKIASFSCGALLAGLLMLDLYSAGTNYYQHPYANAASRLGQSAGILRMAEEQSSRDRSLICAHPLSQELFANSAMYSSIKEAGGAYSPFTPAQALWWGKLLRENQEGVLFPRIQLDPESAQLALLNLMAMKTLVVTKDSPFQPDQQRLKGIALRLLRRDEQLSLYVNESAMPRAYWTPRWREAASPEDAVAKISETTFNPLREAIVEQSAFQNPPVPKQAQEKDPQNTSKPSYECRILRDLPEEVVVEVNAPQAGILVLADAYAPGWVAELDGEAAPIVSANLLFRGLWTPPGKHLVVFRYTPPGFRLGLIISLSSLLMIVCLSALCLLSFLKASTA